MSKELGQKLLRCALEPGGEAKSWTVDSSKYMYESTVHVGVLRIWTFGLLYRGDRLRERCCVAK